ncbi:hypothetical protein BDR07DRAFT_1425243 [Suillus spraguei]|nr:hypothetical protein BDR07DRAFT_1425243 [Suillus spraguei]
MPHRCDMESCHMCETDTQILKAQEMTVFSGARNVTGTSTVQVMPDVFQTPYGSCQPRTVLLGGSHLIVVACGIIRHCQVTRLFQYTTASN